jgi:hypothetical protein
MHGVFLLSCFGVKIQIGHDAKVIALVQVNKVMVYSQPDGTKLSGTSINENKWFP